MANPLPPAVFHLRNRVVILVASPPVLLLAGERFMNGLRRGEVALNWLAGFILWLFLALLALRRRIVLTTEGLEYTDFFAPARYSWSVVTDVVTRKFLGAWPVEGLAIRAGPPDFREVFIDLNQFGRSWRKGDLGAALRTRAPHLDL